MKQKQVDRSWDIDWHTLSGDELCQYRKVIIVTEVDAIVDTILNIKEQLSRLRENSDENTCEYDDLCALLQCWISKFRNNKFRNVLYAASFDDARALRL